MTNNTAAVILAAGRSTRMQTPKALLPFNERENFLDKLLSTYISWNCDDVIVVLNQELAQHYTCPPELMEQVTFVINNHLEYERFYSVLLGMQNLMKVDYCFIQNVDNPFITEEILDILHLERSPDEWVSPRFQGKGGHPILLNSKIMNHIRECSTPEVRLDDVLKEWPCRHVEMPDESILININDLDELEKHRNKR